MVDIGRNGSWSVSHCKDAANGVRDSQETDGYGLTVSQHDAANNEAEDTS